MLLTCVYSVISWLRRFLRFPVVSSITAASLCDYKQSSNVVVVAYISACDTRSQSTFAVLAQTMHPEFVFCIAREPALASAEGINMPGIAVYKTFEDEQTVVPVQLTDDVDQMVAAVRRAAQPLIVNLVVELHNDFLNVSLQRCLRTSELSASVQTNEHQVGLPLGYIFADAPEERNRIRAAITPLAQRHRSRIQFGIADPKLFPEIIKDLQLDTSRLPAFAIREPTANLRFPMNHLTAPFDQALTVFVEDFLNGILQLTIDSGLFPYQPHAPSADTPMDPVTTSATN